VHIADVSYFVQKETPLDTEAEARGNSTYFPGYVIPMLPEVLSNGVCSLQEAVPRLCKSAFITYDSDARPIRTKFANTLINSRKRLRYREAQALLDRAETIPHPEGDKRRDDYAPEVLELLDQMNTLAKRLQKRRREQGQLVLDLPQIQLVLDEEGKVKDAVPEDTSFTHTLIEMFMVEANEAVARLLDSLHVPFLRRTHPEPDAPDADRLRQFIQVAGHKLPKHLDRKGLQQLLESIRGKPEAFAINLAILKSLTRAEYSPEQIGHYALASEHYCHFTSPIRRYADLTIHRLLDAYFLARGDSPTTGAISKPKGGRKGKLTLDDIPTHEELVQIGKHISFTERRSQDAERELRQVKLLMLMSNHVGDEFTGVVTGITNFGVFIQINPYLIDGLIRYEDLMDDWWDVTSAPASSAASARARRSASATSGRCASRRWTRAARAEPRADRHHLPRRPGQRQHQAAATSKHQKAKQKGKHQHRGANRGATACRNSAAGGAAGAKAHRADREIHRRRYLQGDVWQLIGRAFVGRRPAGHPIFAMSRRRDAAGDT
jgi:ribonuclease R